MTRDEIAREIAEGLVKTGIEGAFDSIAKSTAYDYPSIGCSQWEGSRADELLKRMGGEEYAGRSYRDLQMSGDLAGLKRLLGSENGRKAQLGQLAEDCRMYYDVLHDIPTLDDSRCIIYAGMWCPTSHNTVRAFLIRRQLRGYNLRSLAMLNRTFREEYAVAAGCIEYSAGYASRAERTYEYVAGIDLSKYGVLEYGAYPHGR